MVSCCTPSTSWLPSQDGFLNNEEEHVVRQRIAGEIRRSQPAAVFTWSPYLDFLMYQV